MGDDASTDFGFERVASRDKARRVRTVFDTVADRYDLMNDLMSAGLHRAWKRFTVAAAGLRPGMRVLDLAGGTGDMARLAARRVGASGTVIMADVNGAMLERGRRRLVDAGHPEVACVRADAESLPFPDGSFDRVSIAFGLRNVTHKDRALRAMHRILRPGGQALVLEFSTPTVAAMRPAYDFYSLQVLPWLGRIVAGSPESYRYLAESIRRHPDQAHMQALMEEAGFERCSYHNLTAGVVCVHRGYRL